VLPPRQIHTKPLTQNLHHNPATMSSGEVLKADKDFSKEVDKVIPEAEKLGSVSLLSTEARRELT
jgi:hypothetical protein